MFDEKKLGERVEANVLGLVGVRSDSNTQCEKGIEKFFEKWFASVGYFQEHREHCGFYPIAGDHLDRHVSWAMRKGSGNDTVVLIHHNDCVETSDYSGLESLCLEPYKLEKAYRDEGEQLPDEIAADLDSGEWLFGRGVADMKGGGGIEMALMESYCQQKDFKGNVVMLSLPDEENLSAGMRAACLLLKELQDKYGLNYVLMIDTEPHERDFPDKPLIYDGSIGKIMPVVYVRGKVAHVGQVYSGLNPINLLARIVRRTELNPFFIEKSGNTVTPAATWLYSKDRKEVYDVSLPMDASGYMSILPLDKSPKELMDFIKAACAEAFEETLEDMNSSYAEYLKASELPAEKLPFKVSVKFFDELYKEALHDSGEAFAEYYDRTCAEIKAQINAEPDTLMIDAANKLIAGTLRHVKDPFPMVVIALCPPYYPSVNNNKLSGPAVENAKAAIAGTIKFAEEKFGQKYSIKNYYTGISDLSYAMFSSGEESIRYIEDNMLLWGQAYDIPLEIIQKLSMPVVNIGPWGKDFHKYTERVFKDDLFRVTPQMVNNIVCDLLGNKE